MHRIFAWRGICATSAEPLSATIQSFSAQLINRFNVVLVDRCAEACLIPYLSIVYPFACVEFFRHMRQLCLVVAAERLSFRDLFRFCYLDQEGLDNVFFRLDLDNYAIRAKSVNASRYVLGYRTEQVAELKSRLQEVREQRLGLLSGAEALARRSSKDLTQTQRQLSRRVIGDHVWMLCGLSCTLVQFGESP
jgi:hypothetical protein